MSDPRQERVAPPGPGFPAKVPVATEDRLSPFKWVRLAKRKYSSQFFASLKSRLTPISEKFPCAYIAPSLETAVAELWGDQLTLAKKNLRTVFAISVPEAADLVFLAASDLPALRLCDFTDATTRLAVGIDGGALMSSDLSIPQAWAEMIANHPNAYNGIVYRSRHTDEVCAVLWDRPGIRELNTEITFVPCGAFLDSSAAYKVAGAIGVTLSFVRPGTS